MDQKAANIDTESCNAGVSHSGGVILSICIPTYNRANCIEKTISSIVSQRRFLETGEIEIVVSDNCSPDDTREVVEKFVARFPGKVRYYRNSENILDGNYEKVLSYGRGTFLKLNNDTLAYKPGALDRIVAAIRENMDSRRMLFFSNGNLRNGNSVFCPSLDSFVRTASFYSTWINAFGVWHDDFPKINNFPTVVSSKLINEVLFDLILSSNGVVVNDETFFAYITPPSKGGYNFYKVFCGTYLDILEKYRQEGCISSITLFNEKSRLMLKHILPFTMRILLYPKMYRFETKGAFPVVLKKYLFHPAFYIGVLYYPLRTVAAFAVKRTIRFVTHK